MALPLTSATVMPRTIASVRPLFTSGLENSLLAAKAWSQCIGWLFMVSREN